MHAGHKTALLNPTVKLPDGEGGTWQPSLTDTQKQLWEWYCEGLSWARARIDGDVTVILNGDATSGLKYQEGLVSTRAFDQVAIAAANLIPVLTWPNVRRLRLIEGTQAHDWGEGSAPHLVAGLLQSGFPNLGIGIMRHALFDLDGVTLDVAHHGPGPGGREWLIGNQLRYYVRSVMLDCIVRGEVPPRVILRAHYHTAVRETVRVGEYVTEALISPGLCGLSHYAVQATRSAYMLSFGLALITVEDGRLTAVEPWVRSEDLRTKEAL
jgi:hypothetical protein